MKLTERVKLDDQQGITFVLQSLKNKLYTLVDQPTAPVIYTQFDSADACLQIGQASADVLS